MSYKSGKDLPKEDEVKELKLYVGKVLTSSKIMLTTVK